MAASRVEILNDGGLRQDARRPYELRSTSFQLSTHPSSDGSSTATQGLTTVAVSVFGPREPRNRGLASHDRAVVSVEVGVVPWAAGAGARRTRGDKRLQEIGAAIRQTFEPVIMTHLYPRSEIAIHVQVLSADGGILPTSINATTLALIDAGISLLDYVSSISIGLHLLQPLLDLSQPEESDLPSLVIASLPSSGKITLAQMETRLHVDRFEEMLTLGVEACKVLKEEMDGVVKDRTERIVERRSVKVGGQGTGQGGEMVIDD
ncbi:exosome complex component RRP41 [Cryptococcus neoformans C23]|uniref:Ribosomal RNA-processing protein 41 n=2 Tax=Cryptococcus neoformans TaxID=5207 RepID=A0A854QER0_CRYNE|nr:exosome complex component RRP41 [Cryptococcus neoformans var. grubii H99]AUB24431.1 exosome complex component RRP41 [Cryptococcus neoformans var. grubii]OWZ32182.1 exosome complex component RRP41 [Cryptococcus neoformans var. grubii AD2-60a]OWZ44851.1 exosome complex component RRP41 [Cryptococcus neoformans var. grubii C23]OWZ58448.1 exosome complex component RRP41 [Cryptococcus neoformans var. grubii 125.91]OXC85161.1 exosome complex component RRP41 [Cryptococcus neoformans var. grubii AD1|eukprot:XP_012049637.1 exosome complex component RRP41 [Cryptococcus neoformans var. grubii H99]